MDENENKPQIIVKFTRWHCIELHAFCSEFGCIPKILGYQELPGDWIAIVSCQPRQSALQRTGVNIRLSRRLVGCVTVADDLEVGSMEGDSRGATLLCHGEKLMLVGFDWGGKAGKVAYQTALLNPELHAVCSAAED